MSYTYVLQHDITDCGAACLLTCLMRYGYDIPISHIRKYANTDRKGTSAYGIIKAAKKIGFDANGVRLSKDELINSEFKLPAIAHVVINDNWQHYVVIHEINDDSIIVADPAEGIKRYSIDDFIKIWKGILILLNPTDDIKNNKKHRSSLRSFFEILRPQKKILAKLFFPSLFITAVGILTSLYFSFVVDNVVADKNIVLLAEVFVLVIVLFLIKGGLEVYRNFLMLRLNQELDRSLIMESFYHMVHLPIEFYESRKTGDITSRFTDASKIRESLSSAVLTLMIDMVMAIGGGIVLFFQERSLFLIVLIMIIVYAIVVWKFNKQIRNANREQMENNGKFVSFLTESIMGFETVKVNQYESHVGRLLKELHDNLLKSVFNVGKANTVQQFVTELILKIGETCIITLGIAKVISGTLTIGKLIAFNALLAYFFEPVRNLICLQPMMQASIAAFERLSDILDLPYESNEKEKLKLLELKESININDLTFSYGERPPVFKNLSLNIKAGEKVAFVGESGCGKTTIAKLLLKLYSAEAGQILIGEKDINDISINSIRSRTSYVSQNTFLFSDTILNNITMRNTDYSIDEVNEVSKICKIDDFINSLPSGYNTYLEENGNNLSNGQKQRIAIARALIRRPDIFILDEATSNLDALTEYDITSTIEDLYSNITTIIIAHRLNTIVNCDRIFVMDNGHITECGSHKELLAKKGKYFRMWSKQQSLN